MAKRKTKAAPSKEDKPRTVAHLTDTINSNLGHVKRHASSLVNAKTPAARAFNKQHMAKHLDDVTEHAAKLKRQVSKTPAVKRELAALKKAKPSG